MDGNAEHADASSETNQQNDGQDGVSESEKQNGGSESQNPNNEQDSGSDSEKQAEEQDDNVAQQHAIAFDSCLQPADVGQELLSFGDNIYSIVPAEGKQPVSFFKMPKLESMAFLVQFCTGRNTTDEDDRPKKISSSRYFNSRLFSADNHFAMDTNYIFFAQFVTEMHLAMPSMSIQLRKGKVLTKDNHVFVERSGQGAEACATWGSHKIHAAFERNSCLLGKDNERFVCDSPSMWSAKFLRYFQRR